MNNTGYTLIARKYDTIAVDAITGERLGSFDHTAGASRGTLRGRVVSRTYAGWIAEIEAL